MRKNLKKALLERVKRLKYIKTELIQLVESSLIVNSSVEFKNRLGVHCINYRKKVKYNRRSEHRLYCIINSSTKTTNKKLRLARFNTNLAADKGLIGGFVKKG